MRWATLPRKLRKTMKSELPKITVYPSPCADTRTCDVTKVRKEQLADASQRHIKDVQRAMSAFIAYLFEALRRHDYDKLTSLDHFYADFQTKFAETGWRDNHRKIHRHHLNHPDGVPEDVNLLDVLEFIADCVMAGKARSGEVYPLVLPTELLVKAFENTTALLSAAVIVVPLDDSQPTEPPA